MLVLLNYALKLETDRMSGFSQFQPKNLVSTAVSVSANLSYIRPYRTVFIIIVRRSANFGSVRCL